VIAGIMLLGACATAPTAGQPVPPRVVAPEPVPLVTDAPTGSDTVHRAPVAGFVDALVQLPGYAPFDTTFAFERRELVSDPFLQVLEEELAARGYGLRVSTTLGGRNDVSHVAERDGHGEITRTVSFGEAQMRRRFVQRSDGEWVPTGSLFIRGADASRVTLAGTDDGSPTRSFATDPPDSPDSPDPVIVAAGDGPGPIATTPSDTLPAPRNVADTLPAPRNVAEIGRSNYAGVFEDHADVEELVLVFPDDSMVLGVDNKRLIRETVARVDPQRDLFSILGCSFGRTAIDNGNEVLATGRANRVKEALIVAGVPGERVLDEGCWAGAPAENFPGRGVVLTIKRPRATLE